MAKNQYIKSIKTIVLGMIVLGIIQSCEETSPIQRSGSTDDVMATAMLDGVNEDINGIVLDAMEEVSGNQQSATLGTSAYRPYAGRATCANINLNQEAKRITIDFGEGCTNSDGKERAGLLTIEYTDNKNTEGAVITTSTDNYKVENIGIKGVRTLTNTSTDIENEWSFDIHLEDGVITFEDGSTRTFEGDKSRTWTYNELTEEVTVTETGNIYGNNRLRLTYNETISTPLVYKSSCGTEAIIPISGQRDITIANQTFSINYGEGNCDKEVMITWPNGEEQTFVISD